MASTADFIDFTYDDTSSYNATNGTVAISRPAVTYTTTTTSTSGMIYGNYIYTTELPTDKDIAIHKLNGYFNPNALGVFYKGSLRLV